MLATNIQRWFKPQNYLKKEVLKNIYLISFTVIVSARPYIKIYILDDKVYFAIIYPQKNYYDK